MSSGNPTTNMVVMLSSLAPPVGARGGESVGLYFPQKRFRMFPDFPWNSPSMVGLASLVTTAHKLAKIAHGRVATNAPASLLES